jgi:DNA polymerase III subunit chi
VTRIDFHYNVPDKLHYCCRLARKILRANQRAVLFHEDAEIVGQLDALLWSFASTDFVPHVLAKDALAGQTPLLLASHHDVTQGQQGYELNLAHHDILVHMGNSAPPHFATFVRLIEVVSQDAQDRQLARERVKHYRERGYTVQMHDMGKVGSNG